MLCWYSLLPLYSNGGCSVLQEKTATVPLHSGKVLDISKTTHHYLYSLSTGQQLCMSYIIHNLLQSFSKVTVFTSLTDWKSKRRKAANQMKQHLHEFLLGQCSKIGSSQDLIILCTMNGTHVELAFAFLSWTKAFTNKSVSDRPTIQPYSHYHCTKQ